MLTIFFFYIQSIVLIKKKKKLTFSTILNSYFQVCGKAFNSRDNRNAHRFIHSDKKPYECLVCGMGFMRKPLLYTHMQTQV